MKVSEITAKVIYDHIREIEENLSEDDKTLITAMQKAAISYTTGYTGLSESELDSYEDITIAVLTLISDMWDNRSMTVDRSNVNRVVDNILSMHCINLLPTAEVS